MNCLICQSSTKVTNSRTADQGRAIKRRRVCSKCKSRFTTYERLELTGVQVLKRDGSKQPYARYKLELGLRKALEKRPYTEKNFQRIVAQIEHDIFNRDSDAVSSVQIGQIVLSYLKDFDEVAYLRFASVYRNFKSPRAFEREIQKLEKVTSRSLHSS